MKGDEASKGRNWQEYNESLVKRGEMYLTFDFLECLDTYSLVIHRASGAVLYGLYGLYGSFSLLS